MADYAVYAVGSRPQIFINWDSFTTWGIPAGWQGPFTDAVINAYTRWMQVAGADCRHQFAGYTSSTSAGAGQLLIQMNEHHFTESRIASTFTGTNEGTIVFHRKDGATMTPWNFVPYQANAGEIDMQAILMHELGHSFWLDHSSNPNDTMYPYYSWPYRFGPYDNDAVRVLALYGACVRNSLRQFRSVDGGITWAQVPNELTASGSSMARTTITPGVAPTPGSGFYVVSWVIPGRPPSWLRGDGDKFNFRHWLFYGGLRSVFGPSLATNQDSHTILWTEVTNDDMGTIQVIGSTNEGWDWYWAGNPAGATSYGLPGLCWTRVAGQPTWVLVWSHFDRADQANSGYLRASISTDDGWTWSAPVVLNGAAKALSGASVAADPNNHILVAFAWAPTSLTALSATNQILALDCQVVAGQLQATSITGFSAGTRIQPSAAYDSASDSFIMAFREQNYLTSLLAMRRPAGGNWSGPSPLGASTHVAPAIAGSPQNAESVLWYAYE